MSEYRTSDVTAEVKLRVRENDGEDNLANLTPDTVCCALDRIVKKFPQEKVLFSKNMQTKEWEGMTWTTYYEKCTSFAKTLVHLELQAFEVVNIIGFNSTEWFISDVGSILAGCVAAGIYTTSNPESCSYISNHSKARVVVCDGIPQLEKFISIQDELPHLKALVMYNDKIPEDLKANNKIPIYTFDEFLTLGKDVPMEEVTKRKDAQKPGNCCTLIYTSGTTGTPKAVMISHDNINFIVQAVIKSFGNISPEDKMLSYLPLSHVAAQLLDIHASIFCGMRVYFAQPDALKGSLGGTLKEVRPTIFFGVPRVWEKIAAKLQELGAQTTGLKKRIATWAKDKGNQHCELMQYGNSGGAPCGYGCAHRLVLGVIKTALGLDECRMTVNGAAPLSREVIDYFSTLDMPILDLYGQSECCGPQTINFMNAWKVGTAGRKVSGTEMKIVPETEEIVYRGRHVMMGYMNNEESTAATIDDDGWLHSGDCGKIDADGFLRITGRIKELLITAGGENVAPVPIEGALKEISLVANAMAIGDQRKFISAILTLPVVLDDDGYPTKNLDASALKVCNSIGSTAKTVGEAMECPKIKAFIDEGVKKANEKATSRASRVAKWAFVDTDFTPAGGELTPTLKLKRKIVMGKYESVIESLYSDAKPADVKLENK